MIVSFVIILALKTCSTSFEFVLFSPVILYNLPIQNDDMKNILLLLFATIQFLSSFPVHAEENFWNKPPHPNGPYGYDENLPDLLNIKGLTYHKARPIIIGAGWSPLQTLQEGTEDYEMNATFGESKLFWSKGYHEVQTCTGAGMAYCAFLFQNKNGDQLRVVTKGEEWEEYSSFAKVAGYRFNP